MNDATITSGEQSPEAALPAEPEKILIADDDDLLAQDLTERVTQLGYETIGPASDGERAIELAKTHRPNMALLDIRMPVITGLGAAVVLFKHMEIPVILVTAHSDDQYIDASRRVGVFGYLMKPVSEEELRVSIPVGWSRYCEQMELRGRVTRMKMELEDRKTVERAKGLLMDKLGLGEKAAMQELRKRARDSRRRLADFAKALVDADGLLSGGGAPRQSKRR